MVVVRRGHSTRMWRWGQVKKVKMDQRSGSLRLEVALETLVTEATEVSELKVTDASLSKLQNREKKTATRSAEVEHAEMALHLQ